MAGSSAVEERPPQHQVFINFRGKDLRFGFVSHLVKALEDDNINVFIDDYEEKGKNLERLLTRIEESRIVLAIFSGKYTDSIWCMRELAKIKDCVDEGTLVAIPIFYKVDPSAVSEVKGEFGDAFRVLAEGDERKKEWKIALEAIAEIIGFPIDEKSKESKIVKKIVKAVKRVLYNIPSEGIQIASVDPPKNSNDGTAGASSGGERAKTFGNQQRLKELEEKLDINDKKTRIIGVVGMPGIGKTTLLKELFEKWRRKFSRRALIDKVREKSNSFGLDWLPKSLLEELLALKDPRTDNVEDPYEEYKGQLLELNVLIILDDVGKREHIDALLGRRDWISEGSRIVIATNDLSLLKGLVDDPYVVHQLNHTDGLQLFRYHAFDDDDQAKPPLGDFMKLSEEFVHYARGHPLALKILGRELHGKNKVQWEEKLKQLARNPSRNIASVFQVSYDELTSEQKDAFLDIACFRSQDKDYVESLLASSDPGSAEAMSAVTVLTNKFLINNCDGRVEMHDLLYTFSRGLDPKASTGSRQRRLWLHQDIIKGGDVDVLQNQMRAANVRGIFLDMSEVKGETSLDRDHFRYMCNLRYLKFYNSRCPQECKTNNKINMRDGLKLPSKEVRCLHWLKFPLDQLPKDFDPINLVNLKLPYSEIERLWDGVKDTPSLKVARSQSLK